MELTTFWFILIAFLFVGFFVLEGFDFGVGMLFPILGRSEKRRRVLLNTIGPVWDGNEVWIITAGGALFAAFPVWYATLASGFYLPLLVLLVAMIARICAIEWRGKINDDRWRWWCDFGIGLGSWIPPIAWGLIFGNLVRGLPLDAEQRLHLGFADVFNGYALLGALTTTVVFLLHGTFFVGLKTAGVIRDEATKLAVRLVVPVAAVAFAFALWTQLSYGKGWTWGSFAVAVAALLGAGVAAWYNRERWAFFATTVAIAATVVLLFGSLFPNVMPSHPNPANSLTVDNASSSHYTLVVMSWFACIAAPVVLIYQGWTYWVFRKRISVAHIPAPTGLPL